MCCVYALLCCLAVSTTNLLMSVKFSHTISHCHHDSESRLLDSEEVWSVVFTIIRTRDTLVVCQAKSQVRFDNQNEMSITDYDRKTLSKLQTETYIWEFPDSYEGYLPWRPQTAKLLTQVTEYCLQIGGHFLQSRALPHLQMNDSGECGECLLSKAEPSRLQWCNLCMYISLPAEHLNVSFLDSSPQLTTNILFILFQL